MTDCPADNVRTVWLFEKIKKADGKKAFIPGVDEFVKSVDLEKGIAVCVIEGLL